MNRQKLEIPPLMGILMTAASYLFLLMPAVASGYRSVIAIENFQNPHVLLLSLFGIAVAAALLWSL